MSRDLSLIHISGVGGGEAGDLLLKVNVQDKPGYKREGRDIYTTVNIPFTTAVFGGEDVYKRQVLYMKIL